MSEKKLYSYKVKIVKEVKRSEGLRRFACGNVCLSQLLVQWSFSAFNDTTADCSLYNIAIGYLSNDSISF